LPCEYSNLSRRQSVKSQQERSVADLISPAENASGGNAVVCLRAAIASSWLSKLSATAIAQLGGRHGGVPASAHSDRMAAQTAARIAAFLDAHHVMSLATSGRDGPHAASLFYVRDGFALLWVSDPRSRHSEHIEGDPRVAATVASECMDIAKICGVQIAGHAHVIGSDRDRAAAQSLIDGRYPGVKRLAEGCAALREACATIQLYRLEPMRMVLIDNSRGFAHKDTLGLEEFSADSLLLRPTGSAGAN